MNSKSVLRTVAAALAVSLTMIPLTAAAPKPSPRVTVMVDTAENVAAEEILSAIGEAELLYEYDLIDAFAASVPENRLGALQSAPGVLSVTEEAVFTAPTAARGRTFGDKDIDPRDGVIRAERADTGAGSVIAILDTGFNVEHPSFAVPDSFTRSEKHRRDTLRAVQRSAGCQERTFVRRSPLSIPRGLQKGSFRSCARATCFS